MHTTTAPGTVAPGRELIEKRVTGTTSLAHSHSDFVTRFLPAVQKRARRLFGHLRCAAQRADLEQYACLHAWASYVHLAERGRLDSVSPWAVARIACLRAKCGHSVHGAGRKGRRFRKEDVYDWQNRTRQGYRLEYGHEVDRAGPLHPRYLSPAEEAIFRLDFTAWLGTRNPTERATIDLLAAGECPSQAAQTVGVSPTWICRHRTTWRRSWRRFHGR